MKFHATPIAGLTIVSLEPRRDERGFFARSVCHDEFAKAGLSADFVQSNMSYNRNRGIVRGLHYQIALHAEVKLVRCIHGAVFDVAVDLRPDSATFLHWFGVELSAENRQALYIPKGFAHGYQALIEDAELFYQVSTPYCGPAEQSVRFDEPRVGIEWPLPITQVSPKDLATAYLAEADLAHLFEKLL
jgi:dTDP-4-dehydrorhamnose 3,5-epimerase